MLKCKKCGKSPHTGFYEIIKCATNKNETKRTSLKSKRKATKQRTNRGVSRRTRKPVRSHATRTRRPKKG